MSSSAVEQRVTAEPMMMKMTMMMKVRPHTQTRPTQLDPGGVSACYR